MKITVRGVALSLLSALLWPAAFAESLLSPLSGKGAEPAPPWRVVGLPQQTKPFTQFSLVELDGKQALRIEADASYGNLVHSLKPVQAPAHLSWQWRVERALSRADLHSKSGDDTAVKVCVFFDEPMDAVPFAERQVLRIGRSRSTEPVPTATLCYVWDATLPAGTALDNAFTRRVRYMVLQSGVAQPARWVGERREVGSDFLRVFGDEIKTVPPIVGIAIGADADNTKDHSVAYVSDLALEP
ncbi:MAG: DUF3047 domain-containing protein [Pseudomonadota bacterium]|nr:DUF3047 domain-containing protein [Pseudomonadota bacterium]